MKLRSWLYALRQTIESVSRGGLMSLASVVTVVISLLVLAVVILMAVNVQNIAHSMEDQLQIKVYLDEKLPADREQALVQQVTKMPGVAQATFVTKEQELDRAKKQFGEHKDVLDGLDEINPLRDSIEIKVNNPQLVTGVAADLSKQPGVANVDYGKDTVDKLLRVTSAVRVAGIGLVALLVVATVFTISNTIRLAVYARRREISIMKLVGATDWFIRRPFIIEGVLLGVVGSLVALLITGVGYSWVATGVINNMPFLPVVKVNQVIGLLSASLLGLGAVLGAVGSVISLRRYLNV